MTYIAISFSLRGLIVTHRPCPIGFYHTGPQLRSSDLDISERLKRFMPRPVSNDQTTEAEADRDERWVAVPSCKSVKKGSQPVGVDPHL
jgi:hypothetical protein